MIIFSRAIARKAHAVGAQMSFGLKAAWWTQNWPLFRIIFDEQMFLFISSHFLLHDFMNLFTW